MKFTLPSLRDLTAAARSLRESVPAGGHLGHLNDLTATLQRALGNGALPNWTAAPAPGGTVIDGEADTGDAAAGRFISLVHRDAAGSRPYKLYVPARTGPRMKLVVMLHGCTQNPDDFAAGTRMNRHADAGGFLVAYPEQTQAANAQRCWNWFNGADQQRGAGEPALIAGITRAVMQEHDIDPRGVFIAGLSAGGAAAAIMAATYPELYAGVGIHSGLACGAATSLPAALSAMRSGHPGAPAAAWAPAVPVIVFHGDRDTTVNPANGDAVIARAAGAQDLRSVTEDGRQPGGHAWRRTRHVSPDGTAMLEQWTVFGAGHAWSGGSPDGSYTDAKGPDATAAMLRFFGIAPG